MTEPRWATKNATISSIVSMFVGFVTYRGTKTLTMMYNDIAMITGLRVSWSNIYTNCDFNSSGTLCFLQKFPHTALKWHFFPDMVSAQHVLAEDIFGWSGTLSKIWVVLAILAAAMVLYLFFIFQVASASR